MLYFLHNYELPAIENEANNGRRDEEAYLDEAVQIIVEGIEMVAGQQHNNINQQQAAAQLPNPDAANINIANAGNNNNDNVNDADGGGDNAGVSNNLQQPPPPLNYIVHRVILFATDTSFLQTFREFIRILLQRVNVVQVEVVNERGGGGGGEVQPSPSMVDRSSLPHQSPSTENSSEGVDPAAMRTSDSGRTVVGDGIRQSSCCENSCTASAQVAAAGGGMTNESNDDGEDVQTGGLSLREPSNTDTDPDSSTILSDH